MSHGRTCWRRNGTLLLSLSLSGCAADRIATRGEFPAPVSSATQSPVPPEPVPVVEPQSVAGTSLGESSPVHSVEATAADESDLDSATIAAEVSEPARSADEAVPASFVLHPLTIDDILFIADAQNPNIAWARERIREAYAQVELADALWLPSIRGGLNYNHHEGTIQDVAGTVFPTNRSAFYGGLGAGAVGANSPAVPGLLAQFRLTDAIFQPKIASHLAASREFAAAAERNDVLRDAAVAYLQLLRAEQGLAIAQEALTNTERLADLARQYAETGQGLRSDFQRLETELALRQNDLLEQRESVQIAAARLAQLLHADQTIRITTGEPAVIPLNLITPDETPAACVATALTRRPELHAQKHLVCEAVERLRREKFAPLIPSVLLGMSFGGMGGGLGTSIINSGQRWDADAMAFWEVRNLGLGERAARAESASVARQAQLREVALLDAVAREVVEAHAQVVQRRQRVQLTRNGIVAAEQSYALNVERIEQAQGLPIEVLQAIQALAVARRNYLDATIDYNIAQFELCRATGWFTES